MLPQLLAKLALLLQRALVPRDVALGTVPQVQKPALLLLDVRVAHLVSSIIWDTCEKNNKICKPLTETGLHIIHPHVGMTWVS